MKIQGSKINFPGDVIAAITGSISALPDGMASGVMARVNPVHGLYAAIIGSISGAWSTSSVHMSVTTTSALALATGSALKGISENEKLSAIILLTVTAGVIQLLMGILKMGFLIRFISNSVMRGFLTGVAFLIILGQTADFSGNYDSTMNNKVLKTFDILIHPMKWNIYAIATALATLVLIFLIYKTKLKKLAIFFAIVLVSVFVHLLYPDSLRLVVDENEITASLPGVFLPDFKLLPELLLSALAIALIGFIQGAGVSHMKPNPDGNYPNESNDLRGQGIANIFSGIFSGIPAGGSMGQTSLIYNSGGRSRWANFLSGIFIALLVVFLADLIELIPMACFAAILIISGIDSINKEEISTIWQTNWYSRIIMIFTFIMTLSVSIQIAVLASVILTFVLHVVRASNMLSLKRIDFKDNQYIESSEIPKHLASDKIIALQPRGSLFFAGAYALMDILPQPNESRRPVVLFVIRGKTEIGSSFIHVIKRYAEGLKRRDGKLVLVGISDNVYSQLERTGMLKLIGEDNIYKSTKVIGKPFKQAWNDAEKWLNSW